MWSQQEKIIQDIKQIHSTLSFREISEQTGIQLTRVFRLLNGHEMKLSEFLAFQELIKKNKNLTLSEKCQQLIDHCDETLLTKIKNQLEYQLKRKNIMLDSDNQYNLLMEA